jgi:ABC-type nitrate/sulfonate/bicarbonate transport system permease component
MVNNRGRVVGVGLVLLGLVAWEAASLARWLNPFLFPPVHTILAGLVDSVLDGRLASAIGVSLARGGAGYLIAAVAGIGLGTLAGYHRVVREAIEPVVEFVRPLPSPAIIPVAILFLGIGASMKVFIVAWACFFPILLNTVDGVRAVPTALIETSRNLGLGYVRTLRDVILPAASPTIGTGLRISLAIMLILTVVAEMVAGSSGIGYLILEAERTFRVAEMYGFILVLAAVGFLLNRGFLAVDRRLLAWHHAMQRRSTP